MKRTAEVLLHNDGSNHKHPFYRKGHVMASANSNSLRCAFYGRMSSDEQEHSLESQRMVSDGFATSNGHTIVEEYLDAGIAGDLTADRRPAFQKMMRDARDGKFDAVLVRDPSRLSRSNSIKGSTELEPLYDAKVLILTVSGLRMDLSDMAGRIQLQLWFEMAHADNRNRGLAVANGMLRCARNASWVGGRPMGMEIVGTKGRKQLAIGDKSEVRIVKRIFREYDKGATIEAIARGLEADGIRTVTGNAHWNHGTIAGILKNPAYVGDFAFAKNTYGKYHTVANDGISHADGKRIKNAKSDWIIIPNVYPAIIDREQFDRVEQRIGQNKSYSNNSEAFLLSSKLRCAHCDEPMYGRTMRSGNRQYECNSCHATVNETNAVNAIVEAVANRFNPKRVEGELRKLLQPAAKADPKERKRLEREVDRQKRKLVMLDDDAELIQLVKSDIDRIRRELERFDAADTVQSHSIDAERRIRKALSKLADLPKAIQKASHEATRRLLQATVDCCHVTTSTTGKIRKRYHLTGGEIMLALNSTVSTARVNPDRANCVSRIPFTIEAENVA